MGQAIVQSSPWMGVSFKKIKIFRNCSNPAENLGDEGEPPYRHTREEPAPSEVEGRVSRRSVGHSTLDPKQLLCVRPLRYPYTCANMDA